MMSQEVLSSFWKEVFLPAILRHAQDSWTPNMDQSLKESKYKSRKTGDYPGGRGSSKILPLSNRVFLDVQWSMCDIILDNYDILSMYGSFFVVVEGKGIKLLTL